MMSAKMAERYAAVAWSAFCQLTASEIAAQECIGGTPKDFESFALQYLAEAFLVGHPRPLTKRLDLQSGHRNEDETGEYHFELPENRESLTYWQAKTHLDQTVTKPYVQKFKQLHAKGKSAWQAYSAVLEEWEEMCQTVADQGGR